MNHWHDSQTINRGDFLKHQAAISAPSHAVQSLGLLMPLQLEIGAQVPKYRFFTLVPVFNIDSESDPWVGRGAWVGI